MLVLMKFSVKRLRQKKTRVDYLMPCYPPHAFHFENHANTIRFGFTACDFDKYCDAHPFCRRNNIYRVRQNVVRGRNVSAVPLSAFCIYVLSVPFVAPPRRQQSLLHFPFVRNDFPFELAMLRFPNASLRICGSMMRKWYYSKIVLLLNLYGRCGVFE